MRENNYAVIMAGGVGSRFWPVSTAAHPKQFRDLLGKGETLIQTTFKRLSIVVPAQNIYILTNEAYEDLVREQLPQINEEQVLLEPVMRNTAPAVLLAALKIRKKNKDAVMIMAPSDHWIEDESAFALDVETAFEAARDEPKIITLGVTPTFPNTGYGYIKYDPKEKGEVKSVKTFTEKPGYEQARHFISGGDHLWNAGIFIWNVDFIVRAFRKNLPEMFRIFTRDTDILNTSEEKKFVKDTYPAAENISIDYGILEREKGTVYVIPASFDWNDLGTWGSVHSESLKDEHENVALNVRLLAENSSGNIITSDKNKVVIIDGLNDHIVVDENEILLIVPKSKEQEIKDIRKKVQQKFGENLG
ncbi:mannose-1-phosphate guanylyltransferase [Salinimicrobium oceani]|uniref:Mannose-1-phosphate guanylyltransferase n=1 Tax=Salinimicrobium oceani TaxID=2722702 RepID=A0ABX1D3J3_9FLAO|nr:mannose-1-phosphate guanylyltransferase [Salinimicrobium oceani]NJW53912.1 mannose-1-phosphate guanylyltransferase [Salinimicrobium oceani]